MTGPDRRPSQDALAALGATLEDSDASVRLAAGLALYAAGAWRERVLAVLIDEALLNRPHRSTTEALFSLRPLPAVALDRIWAAARPGARGEPSRSIAVALFLGVARDDPSQSARLASLIGDEDEQTRLRAWRWFRAHLPPEGVFDALAADLRDDVRRGWALEALREWRGAGPSPELMAFASRCIEGLLEARRDPDPRRRARAVEVLGWWCRERDDLRAVVAEAFDDPSPSVRREAAGAMAHCEDMRNRLMRAALDPAPEVREGAVIPLLTLAPRPEIDLDFWRAALADPVLEQYAVRGLGRLRTEDAIVVPLLAEKLQSPLSHIQMEAGASLSALAEEGSQRACAVLEEHPDAFWGRHALVSIGRLPLPSVAHWIGELRTSESTRPIDELVRAGAPAVVPLAAELTEPWGSRAAEALLRISRAGHGPLLAALETGSESARRTVLEALIVQCARAAKQPPERRPEGIDDLVRAAVKRSLEDEEPLIQRTATRLLPYLDRTSPSPEIVARLAAALESRPDRRCLSAVSLLARIGPAAAPAVPALLRLLRGAYPGKGARHAKPEPPPTLRRRVAFALGSVGPGASAAIPALIHLLADPCSDVRRNAAWALGRVALEPSS